MDIRQLIPAGAQECGRCTLEQLDVNVGMNLGGQIHIHLIQETLNAVKHSIHLVESPLLGRLVDACQAGINHGGGASRLPYNNITFLCHFNSPPIK